MLKKRPLMLAVIFMLIFISLSCDFLFGSSPTPAPESNTVSSEELEATAQMMALQILQTAQAQMESEPPPAATLPPPPTLTSEPTAQPTETTQAPAPPPAETELIKELSINRNKFYCIESDGPTTVTFTVEMTDIDRGLAIFWRLVEKGTDKTSEWQNVSMRRQTSTARTFTFDANAWDGTNNFYYPPGYGESWFQFQLISGDAKYRTSVYRDDITFFPCAQ